MTDYSEIRRLAKGRHISLTDLSETIGMWRNYFYEMERNGLDIPWNKLCVIADTLRVDPERLVRFE
ncbi:MAG: helix-turn-helix transcriptional regulator [Clostridia bacterium]|nr:helix-turn-helix transcriptional regulator [Clostridia bacterium]